MEPPISPPPERGGGGPTLPAYLSNGVIGLRVRDNPLWAGMTLVSGYTGEHAVRRIEAAALAPYPVAGDLQLGGVWMSDTPHMVETIDQAYDFAAGELTTRIAFRAGEVSARLEILTFCSRASPTLVCQETVIELDGAAEVALRATVDGGGVDGRVLRHLRETPGEAEPACDGVALWESPGGMNTCGVAYATELVGAESVAERPPLSHGALTTEYRFPGRSGRRYRLRQMASVIPSPMHADPDFQAVRLVALARRRGFEAARAANRAEWAELWKGRIRIVGGDERWQAMADAAFFYLMSSTHTAAPASTSIFGLATWHDYHYYFGHVMWDIETFAVPVLSLLQPDAAASILDYRFRNLPAAASNARLRGRKGLQFPWESAPSTGQEAAPMPGSASWHEDHISLDVAGAFARHARVTGDGEFRRAKAWPVLSGVAEWLTSRVTPTRRGYEIRAAMGIAERKAESDNAAFTNMSAAMALREANATAAATGQWADPRWAEIADGLVLPMRDDAIVSHDDYRTNEEKGATPDPLMGVFPLGFPMTPEVEAATLKFYLDQRDGYLGSPMLSALYPVWAAYAGDRRLAAQMLEEGYGKFCVGRFLQTLEYRDDVFPEQPRAGPFFANLGGFLMGLLYGLPGLSPDDGEPSGWAKRRVNLPAGWEAIEVDRLWIHGRPWRLAARQGEMARLTPR